MYVIVDLLIRDVQTIAQSVQQQKAVWEEKIAKTSSQKGNK
jgi:hypothetical protein